MFDGRHRRTILKYILKNQVVHSAGSGDVPEEACYDYDNECSGSIKGGDS
jgi:hypothetical protein